MSSTATTSPEITAHSARTVVLSKDLFFGMRIRWTMQQLGYSVSLTQDSSTFLAKLSEVGQTASLGFVDFNQPVSWDELASAISTGVPIIAFGSHKDVEGFRAAKAAGVARVVSNGEFSRSLPALVEKYATVT